MRAVLQIVSCADVVCEENTVGKIGKGLLIFLGVDCEDTSEEAALMASKIANLRIFKDDTDKMNLSLLDVSGDVLAVSNFTLCADASHGRRPAYTKAARPEQAEPLYDMFCDNLRAAGVNKVEKGVFGGDMKVSLLNDGPVTIVLDTSIWK